MRFDDDTQPECAGGCTMPAPPSGEACRYCTILERQMLRDLDEIAAAPVPAIAAAGRELKRRHVFARRAAG